MKKTIIIIAATALFVALATSVQAQNEEAPSGRQMPGREEMAGRKTDMMADSLSLSDEQKEAVLSLNLEYMDKLRPMGRPMGRPRMRPGAPGTGGGEASSEDSDGTDKPKSGFRPEPGQTTPGEAGNAREEYDKAREEYDEALRSILSEEQYAKYGEMQNNMRRPGDKRGKGRRGCRPDAPGACPGSDE